MLKTAIATLLLLPFSAGMATAQGPNSATTMVYRTSDGTVRITDRAIFVADYHLQLESVVRDGVLRFSDPGTGATAVLDARESRGLYLEVQEGGAIMQLVASTDDIRYESNDHASDAGAPSLSSVLTLLGNSPEAR